MFAVRFSFSETEHPSRDLEKVKAKVGEAVGAYETIRVDTAKRVEQTGEKL